MKLITVTFDGTGADDYTFPGGDFFQLYSSTSPVTVTLYKNNSKIDETAEDAPEGYTVDFTQIQHEGFAFDYGKLHSATAQTIEIAVSQGQGSIRTKTNVDANNLIPTSLLSTQDQTVPTGAAAVEIAAANSDRERVMIRSLSTNPDTVRIGGSDVAADYGQPMDPNDQIVFTTTAAIYVFPGAGSNTFAITEEVK